jgi:hypothetical protein
MEKLALHTRLEIANYEYTDKSQKIIEERISILNK